jgi:galactokinase
MITVFRALAEVNGIERTETYRSNIRGELDLADYLGCVENGRSFRGLGGSGGVGTFGGSQDHAAIVAGRPSRLTRFAFGPLRRISDLAFPDDQCFVVASSGVVAEKSGAARGDYNRVALQAAAVTRRFPGRTLASVIEEIGIAGMDDVIRDRCTEYPAAELVRRVRQFYEESVEIIPAVAELIATGRIGATGDLVDRSQFNAESMLGNQVDETVFLHRSARTLGAVAASAFGAGFGGSVYALVGSSDAGAFLEDWRKAYERRFPQRRPQFFKTRVSGIA